MATIATHNGSVAHRDHNIRNEKVVRKEKHIDPKGHYEIWKDEKPREAYHKIFDKAVERYNAKQTREDRKIRDYYTQIVGDKKKHPVYEMIIGVYDKSIDKKTKREILKEFVDTWEERNPNLYLCGAYYHEDEEGEPHVHIDYIPVARGYTKGMDIQTGLVKALEGQGFEKEGKATAQIKWEHRENGYLEKLCTARGIKVEHPREEGRKHLKTEQYKEEKKLKTLQNEVEELKLIKEMDKREVVTLDKQVEARQAHISEIQAQIGALEGQVEETTISLENLQNELKIKASLVETINDALKNLMPRFNSAYERMQELLDHWLAKDRKKYKELVEKTDRPLQKATESVEEFMKHSKGVILGRTRATLGTKKEIDEAKKSLEEATEELEEIEDEYDR